MVLVPDGTPFADHGILVATMQGNDGVNHWRNTIDVVFAAGNQPVYGDPIVSAFVGFLQKVTRDDTHIVKVAFLPYVKGRQPLANQGAIWEQITSLPCKNWGAGNLYTGEASSGAVPVGEVCVMLTKGKFGGGGGRVGRMFIRNALPAAWIKADAGGPPTPDPVLAPTFATTWNAFANTELATFCEDNPLPRFCLIHSQKLAQTPPAHDIFDSAMVAPLFSKLAMHDITSKSRK